MGNAKIVKYTAVNIYDFYSSMSDHQSSGIQHNHHSPIIILPEVYAAYGYHLPLKDISRYFLPLFSDA